MVVVDVTNGVLYGFVKYGDSCKNLLSEANCHRNKVINSCLKELNRKPYSGVLLEKLFYYSGISYVLMGYEEYLEKYEKRIG